MAYVPWKAQWSSQYFNFEIIISIVRIQLYAKLKSIQSRFKF